MGIRDIILLLMLVAFVAQSFYYAHNIYQPEPSSVQSISRTTLPLSQQPHTTFQPYYKDTELQLKPRAFSKHSFPCFPAEERWHGPKVLSTPSKEGFFLTKTWKTGSSTSVGVHLRMAKNMAQRRNMGEMCKTRFEHKPGTFFADRLSLDSFLWTIVRDPTTRMISHFFHFEVARHKRDPHDRIFQETLLSKRMWTEHYAAYAAVHRFIENPKERSQQLFEDYDFIAVTERFDESMVALAMLLDVPITDVLYLKSKGSAGYDDGEGRGKGGRTCTYIVPSFVSPTLQQYFQTDEWQQLIYWDHQIHMAANQSLDLTIDALGRDEFERKLQEYKRLKQKVNEVCADKAIFPCSPAGEAIPYEETNCLWHDSGCGNDCIDNFVESL